MTVVRSIWADMVQKRLWPVAVVLVLLLIAIPVVLAKPAPKAPAPPTPVASSAGPAPLVASPASIRSNSDAAPVEGRFKDPFKQLHMPKPAKATATSTPSGGAAAGGTPSPTPATGGGSSGSSGGSSGGSHKSPVAKQSVTKLKIRFGKADGTRKVQEITAGTPLPGATNPLIVFLDFGSGGDTAHFLVSSDVTKTEGDGTASCKPTQTVCSELVLKPKTTQFFDVGNGDQYQLDVLDVVQVTG